MSHESYIVHNREYENAYTLESVRLQQEGWRTIKVEFNSDSPLGNLLNSSFVKSKIKLGLDIGCGHGYYSGVMAESLAEVIALEPSQAALDIASQLHTRPNISWKCGFAQEVIPTLSIEVPTLFLANCVMSHIDDATVKTICSAIDNKAPKNSVLCFSEIWGNESHEHLWHCRTQQWWQERFPGWTFQFNSVFCQVPGRFKSFTAIK
jgi:2-polyprenyl-3-methyl-5-hydroxy-6-metoxy-1,4-benzoquinol methylase